VPFYPPPPPPPGPGYCYRLYLAELHVQPK